MILIKNETGLHEQWEAGVRVATERKKKMPDGWESALKIRERDENMKVIEPMRSAFLPHCNDTDTAVCIHSTALDLTFVSSISKP